MPEFRIEIPGFNKHRDRLDNAIMQLTAQKIYNSIREKIPEIESEQSSVVFSTIGKEVVLNSSYLSDQLKEKLHNYGFVKHPVIYK